MARAIAICLVLVGCTAQPPKPPCDEATAAQMAAACALRVETECVAKGIPEDQCTVIDECDTAAEKRQNECLK